MKSILFASLAFLLLGAGCATPETPAAKPNTIGLNPCSVAPTQNEAGQPVYPVAPAYESMPHLGQIFTALDCNDVDRAKHVAGFNADGKYTAGILLKWKEGGASGQIREALRKLGFTEPDNRTMRSDYPYSIDDLRSLRDILNDQNAAQALDREDCISCG